MTPEYQYQAQQSVMYTFQQRSNELKSKLQKLGKNNLQKPSKVCHLFVVTIGK